MSNVEADSFFIQLNWNKQNREVIDPANQVLSGIYYTPSFHKAKLIANDSIIGKADVFIQSDGWTPYLRYDRFGRIPVYFNQPSYVKDGQFGVDKAVLTEEGIDLAKIYDVRYVNIRYFNGAKDGTFSLQTRMKCDSLDKLICPLIDLMLVFEKDIFDMELINKGCESNVTSYIGGHYFTGKNKDLTGFGCNVYEWQELTLNVEDRNAHILLNGKEILAVDYQEDYGKLVGLIYSFSGTGAVDYVRIRNETGALVYADEFGS